MKNPSFCFVVHSVNAFTRLDRPHGTPLKSATCSGDRVPIPAGTACKILAEKRGPYDRVLLQLDPQGPQSLFGWADVSSIF